MLLSSLLDIPLCLVTYAFRDATFPCNSSGAITQPVNMQSAPFNASYTQTSNGVFLPHNMYTGQAWFPNASQYGSVLTSPPATHGFTGAQETVRSHHGMNGGINAQQASALQFQSMAAAASGPTTTQSDIALFHPHLQPYGAAEYARQYSMGLLPPAYYSTNVSGAVSRVCFLFPLLSM